MNLDNLVSYLKENSDLNDLLELESILKNNGFQNYWDTPEHNVINVKENKITPERMSEYVLGLITENQWNMPEKYVPLVFKLDEVSDFDDSRLFTSDYCGFWHNPWPNYTQMINLAQEFSRESTHSVLLVSQSDFFTIPRLQLYMKGTLIRATEPLGKVDYETYDYDEILAQRSRETMDGFINLMDNALKTK